MATISSISYTGTRKKSTFQKHIGSCTNSGRKLDAPVPKKTGPDPLRAIRRRVVPHLPTPDQEPEYFWKPSTASITSSVPPANTANVAEPQMPAFQNPFSAWPTSVPFAFQQSTVPPPAYFMPPLTQWSPFEVRQQFAPEQPLYQPFYPAQLPVVQYTPDLSSFQLPIAPPTSNSLSTLLQMLPRPGGLN